MTSELTDSLQPDGTVSYLLCIFSAPLAGKALASLVGKDSILAECAKLLFFCTDKDKVHYLKQYGVFYDTVFTKMSSLARAQSALHFPKR